MGIEGLWPLLQSSASAYQLKDFNIEHGFIKAPQAPRALRIGVDASTFHAADRGMQKRKRQLHTSDTTLTQLQQFLCQLSEAGVDCLFLFDGPGRPEYKRGKKVIHREPDYYKHAKTLIELFGYSSRTATGDAEAELANLNKNGIIDSVLTKDSDVFPFGAECILRYPSHILTVLSASHSKALSVDVYRSDAIQCSTGISRGGFLLIALLLPSDVSQGVNGIGSKTAFSLAQCGFGDELLEAYNRFSTAPSLLSVAFQKLNNDMVLELESDSRGKLGSISFTRAQILRDAKFPSLGILSDIEAFVMPPINPSFVHQFASTLPDIIGLTRFCREQFGWNSELTIKKFHTDLWPAVITRMLCSELAAYKPETSEFFVPQLEPLQSNVRLDSKGTEFIPTYSTAILNHKKLTLIGKDVHDMVSVKFSTDFLCGLAGHCHTDSKVKKHSRRFNVSVVILAWAMKQPGTIHRKASNDPEVVSKTAPIHSALAGSSKQNPVIELTDSDSEDSVIELTESE
ncbi:PIN domain-like protein [Lentinula raphanica]|nr:PIN domain-like protein [Lentinula raphanica]